MKMKYIEMSRVINVDLETGARKVDSTFPGAQSSVSFGQYSADGAFYAMGWNEVWKFTEAEGWEKISSAQVLE